MAAAQELLIDSLVAASAIARRQLGRKDEAVMFLLLLIFRRLMAIETSDTAACMGAQLKFMHHGILQLRVAFRTFPDARTKAASLPGGIGSWPLAVDEERTHDQRKPDHYRDEDSTEWHSPYDRRFDSSIPKAMIWGLKGKPDSCVGASVFCPNRERMC